MQSSISSFQDVQRMMRNEAGRSVLRQLAERYPYFLPLKAISMLLKEEGTATRELLHIYGVNPVVLHYLPHRLREQPKAAAGTAPEVVQKQAEPVVEKEPEMIAEEAQEGVENQPEVLVEESEAVEEKSEETVENQPEVVVESQPKMEEAQPEVVVEKQPEIIGWQPAGASVSEAEVVETEPAKPTVEDTLVVSEAAQEVSVSEPQKEADSAAENLVADTGENSASALQNKSETLAREPVIQPLYTKDYFKHQGVSIDANEGIYELKKPSGNDLMVMRSFGEWLRFFHSKKAKAVEEQQDKSALRAMWQKGKLAAALEEEGEEIPEVVFEMAVKSISHEGNPTTETMARIYLGQGKWEKAIAVYEQLQLRNPQKSAYFAEKIAAIEQQHRP